MAPTRGDGAGAPPYTRERQQRGQQVRRGFGSPGRADTAHRASATAPGRAYISVRAAMRPISVGRVPESKVSSKLRSKEWSATALMHGAREQAVRLGRACAALCARLAGDQSSEHRSSGVRAHKVLRTTVIPPISVGRVPANEAHLS